MQSAAAAKLQYTTCQQRADRVTAEHAEEKHGDSLGQLFLSIPSRKRVDAPGNVSSFAQAQERPGNQEASLVLDENLQSRYKPEDENLSGDPFSWSKLPIIKVWSLKCWSCW